MVFLYASDIPITHRGGAAKTIFALFRSLTRRGHICLATSTQQVAVEQVAGIRLMGIGRVCNYHTGKNKIDVVITQLAGDSWAVDLAQQLGCRSVLVMPSVAEYICREVLGFDTCNHFCLNGILCGFNVNRTDVVTKATYLMVPSEVMADEVSRFYRPPFVSHPVIFPEEHLVAGTGSCITITSGSPLKGVDLFLDLARELPQYNFLLVGPVTPLPPLPNLRAIPPVSDMRQVWGETKVLLVPSIVYESFGMVCVEAGISGIPSITSGKGGLVEASGGTGLSVDRPDRVALWKEEIVRLMEDGAYYKDRSDFIRAYVKNFPPEEQVDIFLSGTFPELFARSLDKAPKVSLVVTLYKSESYVLGFLQDLAAQTFKDFEVILVCNDPTETELSLINSYKGTLDIRVIKVPLEGTAESCNRGLQIARGEYIHLRAGDDRSRPELLQKHIAALDVNPECVLAYSDYERSRDGAVYTVCRAPEFDVEKLKKECYIGPCITFKRFILDTVGMLDPAYKLANDYELWLRIAVAGYKFIHVPEVLATYMERPDALTYANLGEMQSDTFRIQQHYALIPVKDT